MSNSVDVTTFGGQMFMLLTFLRDNFTYPINQSYLVLMVLVILNRNRRGFVERLLRLASSAATLVAGVGLSKMIAGTIYRSALAPALLQKAEEAVNGQGVSLLQALQQMDFLPGFLREDIFVRVQALGAQGVSDIAEALQAALLPLLELGAFAVLYLAVHIVLWLLRRVLSRIDEYKPSEGLNMVFGFVFSAAEALLAAWWMTIALWVMTLLWAQKFPQGVQFIQGSSFYTFFSNFNPFARSY